MPVLQQPSIWHTLFSTKLKITIMSHRAHWIFFCSTRGMCVKYMHRKYCKWCFCCPLPTISRETFMTLIRKEKQNVIRLKNNVVLVHHTVKAILMFTFKPDSYAVQQIWMYWFSNSCNGFAGLHVHGNLVRCWAYLHGPAARRFQYFPPASTEY